MYVCTNMYGMMAFMQQPGTGTGTGTGENNGDDDDDD